MVYEQTTVGEQEYLETIFWLEEAELPITGANIARAMQLAAPTVHEMIGRLEDDGYVARNEDKSLVFTAAGREHAAQVVRRHRLVERFLTDVLGIPWDDVHREAESLEHSVSPQLEERMLAAVGDARTCPHGHPFSSADREPGAPLSDVEPGARIAVLRFENEAEDLLHHFKDAGLRVGLEASVTSSDDELVEVEADGSTVRIKRALAETVSVRAEPSPPLRTALPPEQLLALSKERYGR